jgi:hypothetical protein
VPLVCFLRVSLTGISLFLRRAGLMLPLLGALPALRADLTILRTFGDNPTFNGASPQDELLVGSDGYLYGTAGNVVFRLLPDGTEFRVLRSFVSPDPTTRRGRLVEGPDRNLYGFASRFEGTTTVVYVFRLARDGSALDLVFPVPGVAQLMNAQEGLTLGSDGRLYGITGIRQGTGTVFWPTLFGVNRDGTGFTVLRVFSQDATFSTPAGSVTAPVGDLLEGLDGRLYGVATSGPNIVGQRNGGFYSINKDGTGFRVIRYIESITDTIQALWGPLSQSPDGTLYTTGEYAGTNNYGGAIVSVRPDGSGYRVVRTFSGLVDGGHTRSGLTLGPDGTLYGVSQANAPTAGPIAGRLWAFEPGTGNFRVLHAFQDGQDGALPGARPILGPNGLLYGVATSILTTSPTRGVVYRRSPAGVSTGNTVTGGGPPPTIATHPAGQSVGAGASATFTVVVSGTGPFSYQWRRDGTVIAGATAATLTLANVQAANAGNYTVAVTNAAGAVNTSNPAALTVAAGPAIRLSNLSVRTSLAAGQLLIVGFTMGEGTKPVLVRGIGPTLAVFGLTDALADPRLEIYNGAGAKVDENEDWSAGLAPIFAQLGAFALSAGSRDAALSRAINGGHTAQLRAATRGVALIEVYDAGSGNTPRLTNLSARNQVGTGNDILIAGFTLTGTGTTQILIRGIGPSLAAFGLTGFLANPRIEVFRASDDQKIAENDDWDATAGAVFSRVGAFALAAGSRDSALLATLPAGGYTVLVSGVGNTTGEAIVEVYEVQ